MRKDITVEKLMLGGEKVINILNLKSHNYFKVKMKTTNKYFDTY